MYAVLGRHIRPSALKTRRRNNVAGLFSPGVHLCAGRDAAGVFVLKRLQSKTFDASSGVRVLQLSREQHWSWGQLREVLWCRDML